MEAKILAIVQRNSETLVLHGEEIMRLTWVDCALMMGLGVVSAAVAYLMWMVLRLIEKEQK